LASELGINPNTIQKAYAELESRGVIYSLNARGNFVSDKIDTLIKRSQKDALSKTSDALSEAKKLGIKKDEIKALLDKMWGDTND
jgi:GntR family transcriptional regulator